MSNSLLSALRRADENFARLSLRYGREKNALIAFYFHGVLLESLSANRESDYLPLCDSIHQFRRFVEYFLRHGYTFVTTDDIARGLVQPKKYVMLTFDDGYANNQLMLPLLKEYQVPAVFFIATNNVKRNQAFWWDSLYRARMQRGASVEALERECEWLKTQSYGEIEKYLGDAFGADVFKPMGDADRPFTPAELRVFAREKYVCVGNHTRDHALLPNYGEAEIQEQIVHAQTDLREMTGSAPLSIAYPSGKCTTAIARLARQAGLRVGVTTRLAKNRLPIDPASERAMQLARFYLSRKRDWIEQCELIRSDYGVSRHVKRWLGKE